jgi:hypothetical protein
MVFFLALGRWFALGKNPYLQVESLEGQNG